MAKLSPADFAKKWGQRTTNAIPQFKEGVMKVTESPGMKAAARQDAMLAGVQRAVDSGKWARKVAEVPLEQWKQQTANLGGQRISAGVSAVESKMQTFAGRLLPYQDNLKAAIDSRTPRGDFEANINRMTEWARGMHEFKNE